MIMLKKFVVGSLVLTTIAAAVAAFAYQSYAKDNSGASSEAIPVLAQQTVRNSDLSPQTVDTSEQPVEPQTLAQGAAGDPWQASGVITTLDDNGLTLSLESGESVYIELGPPSYWQTQDNTLQQGQQITVVGTINDGIIHATEVQLTENQVLQVRNDQGQPMWSGGVSQGQGANSSQGDGTHTPDPQAQVDEWITINGTLTAFQGSTMTIATSDGELISFKTGQPRFFADQGVTLQVGEELTVVGYYDNGQFVACEITQVSTGSRLMLRDPNALPLWAGPGNSNGNANGAGNGNRQASGQP
jgi:hypothetical protein